MGCSGSRAVGEDDEDPPSAPTKQLQTEAISVTPRGGLGGSADGALPSGGMGSGDPSARRSSHSAYGSGGEGASGGAGAAPAMGGAGGPTERRGSTTRHIPGTAGRRASYHENVKLTEQYILGKVLGKGGFGEVRAGARKLDGRRCVTLLDENAACGDALCKYWAAPRRRCHALPGNVSGITAGSRMHHL